MDVKFWLGMARDWGVALLFIVAVLFIWGLFQPSPVTQGEAPDFTLADLEGHTVTLSEHRGEVVVLNFWATWCGPCVQEIPELNRFHQQHPDVTLLGVSVDKNVPTSRVNAISKKLRIGYPVVHDPKAQIAEQYGIHTLPTTYVLDENGEIVRYHVGGLNQAILERMIPEG